MANRTTDDAPTIAITKTVFVKACSANEAGHGMSPTNAADFVTTYTVSYLFSRQYAMHAIYCDLIKVLSGPHLFWAGPFYESDFL